MEIRATTPDDLRRLDELWPLPGGVHEAHSDRQRDGAAVHLVAWEGDAPLGSGLVRWRGCVGEHARAEFPGVPEVNHLQVREHARDRGIGTALMEHAERLVSARGLHRVAVAVDLENPRARRLYLRLVYAPTGVLDTVEYDWIDIEGTSHRARETSELLIKDLGQTA